MYYKIETITPGIAKIYLQRNIETNRHTRQDNITRYAMDMRCGRWETENPQNAIIFNADGQLIDGQNRLNAVIKAGVPVDFIVWYDVKNEVKHIDGGAPRATHDRMRLAGLSADIANKHIVAIAKFLSFYVYTGTPKWSEEMLVEYIKTYGSELHISLIISCARSGRFHIKKAPVMSAIYCAYRFGIHEDELRRFAKVCVTGLQEEKWDVCAVLLRNFIIENEKYLGIEAWRYDLFKVASAAIFDFYSHKVRKQRYIPDKITETDAVKYVVSTDAEYVKGLIYGQKKAN